MDVKAKLRLRAALRDSIRGFFHDRDCLEAETPVLVQCPGTEIHLRYFATSWTGYDGREQPLYLRSSPELHMKRLLCQGSGSVFQLAPCFRNHGELSDWHHPEFTMLEWYRTGLTYDQMIQETEDLLRTTWSDLQGPVTASGLESPPLPGRLSRLTVSEAFREFAGVTLHDGDPDLAAQAEAAGCISVNRQDDFETAFFKILIEKVESGLAALGLAVLCDYPPSQAALAVVEDGVARRFEFYWNRVELCNGFKELLNPADNRTRMDQSRQERGRIGYEVPPADDAFLRDLGKGLPPCCGNALGFDRWLALVCGLGAIGSVMPFYGSFHE